MRYVISILLSFASFLYTKSQDNQAIFRHLSSSDGLSNNWVRCIYMDDMGYMWFGTADGLNRYDGHQFNVYRPKTNTGKSIGNINISGVLKKSMHELWVCTDLGVFTYNYLDDKLHPYELMRSWTANCVIEDKEKNFWFGTSNGLQCFNSVTEKITSYVHNPKDLSTLPHNYVNIVFEDSEGNIWIGSKGGISLFVKKENLFKNFHPKDIAVGNSANDVSWIREDHNKRIWVAYAEEGLYALRMSTLPYVELLKIMDGKIMKLLVDTQNNLWIGKGSEQGLIKMPLNHYQLGDKPVYQHFQHDINNFQSLSDNSMFSLYEDTFKDIWIGTFGNGINFYSNRTKKFNSVNKYSGKNIKLQNDQVNAFAEDYNFLYIGTEAGLDVYNKKRGNTIHYSNKPEVPTSLSANPIYSIYKDSHRNIWVGTWAGGLNLFNPATGSFKRYMADGKPGSISNNNIFSIFEDKAGNLWVGTIGGGLNRFNYKTGTFKNYINDYNNTNGLHGDMVDHLFQTSSDRLYVSVYNSLALYDYKNDNFIHFSHSVNDETGDFGNILSVFEDSQKHLWVATNAGLEIFNEEKGEFIPVLSEKQLLDNTIQGILEDDHGNLWISTNKGISKYVNGTSVPLVPVVYNYTLEDGLSGNEFRKRSCFKNNDGIMYFGSSSGFTYFHPDSIKLNAIPPQVVLSNIDLLNPLPAKYKYLSSPIGTVDTLNLPHKNADFVIRFAALNYLNPQNNHFRYKLDGYDKKWIDADYTQTARYTNLNHGVYTFMVIASNNDGIWCSTPRTIKIIIHPPWWNTILFKTTLVLLVAFLLVSLSWLRFRMLRNQKRVLEDTVHERTKELLKINQLLNQKQKEITLHYEELAKYKNHLESIVEERTAALRASKEKAEESDKLKTAFLQNMSHEIRTPLNAIMGFSGLLEDSLDDKDTLAEYAFIIKQKGGDLLKIINDILDISKIEAGSLKADFEVCNLNSLLEEIEIYAKEYQKRFKKEHIQFRLMNHCSDMNADIILDPGKLKQVIINLVGNAFKFTNEGIIELCCSLAGNNILKFHVSDTGIGIPKDQQELIFERFRQIGEMHYHEGTGLGLSISKGIVQLLGGRIWLSSEVNKGTTFYFTVPFTKNHYSSPFPDKHDFVMPNLDNKIIIIAEDDNDTYEYFKILFKDFKVKIPHAKNGLELMDLLDQQVPDLILLDINMPVKSGLECIAEIRRKKIKTKIIVETAYALNFEKETYFEAGCDGYIAKPIKKEELFLTIFNVLAK